MKTPRIRKVVFPVGGLGTRFLPATKSLPKEMLPIVDKPLIHYAFEEAAAAGIEQFVFVTGRNKNAINNHFDHAYELQNALSSGKRGDELQKTVDWLPEPGQIMFIRQQSPLGLGHAIWCARHAIGNEPFAVILADDLVMSDIPCLQQMTDCYADHPGSNLVAVMDVPQEKTNKYGILDVTKDDGTLVETKGLVEKPSPKDAPSNTAIIGRYILQPEIFRVLEKAQAGAGGEIQLTDAINAMVTTTPTLGYRFDGKRFDCGERVGFVEANLAFALNHPEMKDRMKEIVKHYA